MLATHQIASISELIRLDRVIEETEWYVQKCCFPPTHPRDLVKPELGYRRPILHSMNSKSFTQITSDSVTVSSTSQVNNATLYWNCGQKGHNLKKCKNPKNKRVFCCKCVRFDTTTKNCPNCAKTFHVEKQ